MNGLGRFRRSAAKRNGTDIARFQEEHRVQFLFHGVHVDFNNRNFVLVVSVNEPVIAFGVAGVKAVFFERFFVRRNGHAHVGNAHRTISTIDHRIQNMSRLPPGIYRNRRRQ